MDLEGKSVVVVIGRGFQDLEATVPIEFLKEEGAEVVTVGPETGDIKGIHGAVITVDNTFSDLDAASFDAMVVPGGRAPAYLRKFEEARDFVASFAATGKPLAAICHGGQLLAAAGLVEGLTMTGYPKIKDEMLEAGADFVDREVVVDRNIITSRVPDDLPVFDATLKDKLINRG